MLIPFFIGIAVGMIMLTTSLTLTYIMLRNNTTRVKQVVNKLIKKKGILIEPESNDFNQWINNLPSV